MVLTSFPALLRVLAEPPQAAAEKLAYTHPGVPAQWIKLFNLHTQLKDLEQWGICLFRGTHADDAIDFAKCVLVQAGTMQAQQLVASPSSPTASVSAGQESG